MASNMGDALRDFYCANFLREARERGQTAADLEQMGQECLDFKRDMTDAEYQGLVAAIQALKQQAKQTGGQQ